MTLVLALAIGGLNTFSMIVDLDHATCERWGALAIESGEATEYWCLAAST